MERLWWPWHRVWGCSHDVGGAVVNLKTSRDASKKTHGSICKYCIHYCTHPSAGCLVVSQRGSWLSPEQAIQHSKVEASVLLMTLAVTLCQVHRLALFIVEESTPGQENQVTGIKGDHQEAGYHRCVDSFILHYLTFLLLCV